MTDSISARLCPFLRTIDMATPEQSKRLGVEAADHIDAQAARIAELEAALEAIDAKVSWEINLSNYTPQEVCDMNADWSEIGNIAAALIDKDPTT